MTGIKFVRLIVVVGFIAGASWLHWNVIPSLGMFRVSVTKPAQPVFGVSLIIWDEKKPAAAYTLDWVDVGWSLLGETWPLVLIGFLSGLALGYPTGEFSRRKLVIEQMPEKIRRERDAILSAASNIKSDAQHWERKASRLYSEASKLKEESARERQKTRIMSRAIEEPTRIIDEWRHKALTAEKELAKARAKIRRLEEKNDRVLGKFS